MNNVDKWGLDHVMTNVDALKKSLPVKLASQARDYFLKAFQNQAWNGQPWREVNRRKPGTLAYKYPIKKDLSRRIRPIELGRTGNERRAVNNAIVSQTWPLIRFVVDMTAYGASANYAKYQNEGTPRMVARTFMGHTEELGHMQRELIDSEVNRIWK